MRINKKCTLSILSLFCCTILSFAQQANLSGIVIDSTDNAALIGATVLLKGEQDYASITDNSGRFDFSQITTGRYKLYISYLGYEEIEKEISINEKSRDIGKFKLKSASSDINEVVVKGKIPLALTKGDTVEYNADAYITNPDADADDLVKKMPGITVGGGEVTAQGEKVQKVYVDGKPFFDQDPILALKTLPADVIQKIEIFDETSEQAQFTGFEDGETSKVMNIVTRENKKDGQFGKAYAGIGYPDKYFLGGNLNYFNGDKRLSVIGLSNNINQQNFSNEDLLGVVNSSGRGGGRGSQGYSSRNYMVGTQSGISTTHSFGLNYSDKWGEKVKVSGSYFFNATENASDQDILQNYFSEQAGLNQKYTEGNQRSSTNMNHRFHFKLDYNINENNKLIIRPRVSLQTNNSANDNLSKSLLGDSLLNVNTNTAISERNGVSFSNELVYMHNFKKKGRTISTDFDMSLNSRNNNNTQYSERIDSENTSVSDSLNKFSDDRNYENEFEVGVDYTEPFLENGQLMFSANTSYAFEDADKKTFNYDYFNNEYNQPDTSLSNIFNSTYRTQSLGIGYRLRRDKTSFTMELYYQYANLKSSEVFPYEGSIDQNFTALLPSLRFRYKISDSKNLNVRYSSNTQSPGAGQLQNTYDISNPLQLRAGNPNLEQSYNNNMSIRYSSTNTEKARIFFVLCNIRNTNNYVANSTYFALNDTLIDNTILLQQGGQITRPVNLDNYWNINVFTTYGFPIKLIKSNLNINLQYNYVSRPGVYNNVVNYSKNNIFGTGLVLSSNISERFDYNISSNTRYNFANNSVQSQSSDNYLNQNTEVEINLIIWKGIVFNTQLASQYYYWTVEDYSQNYILWNMSLGKKVFKNQLGEIKLSVYDILNQNTSFVRNVTDAYVEDIKTTVLQRFLMLTFSYKLRNFSK